MTMITREVEWWPPGATEARKIRISVTLPVPHPSLGYECTLTVEGFDLPQPQARPGSFSDKEGMVALASALNMVPHVLAYHVGKAGGGRITPSLGALDHLDLFETDRTLDYLAPGASAAVPIQVAISPPYLEHDETWTCALSIRGFRDAHERTVHHADTIGAIVEALYLAPVALRQLVEPGGRLTYRGSADLGFPVKPD